MRKIIFLAALVLFSTPVFAEHMAVVDKDGNVVNVVVVKAQNVWSPPEGMMMVPVGTNAQIGGKWDGTKFTLKPKSQERIDREAAQAGAIKAGEDAPLAKDQLILDLKARVEALEAP